MAVSKIYRIVSELSSPNAQFVVKGFRSAKVSVNVATGGTAVIGAFGKVGSGAASTSDSTIVMYRSDGTKITDGYVTLEGGYHEIFLELEDISRAIIIFNNGGNAETKGVISTFYEPVDLKIGETNGGGTNEWRARESRVIKLSDSAKTINIKIKPIEPINSGIYELKATRDGELWEPLYVYDKDIAVARPDGEFRVNTTTDGKVNLIANVEGYISISLNLRVVSDDDIFVDINVNEYYSPQVINGKASNLGSLPGLFLKGYKYIIIDVSGTVIVNAQSYITASPTDESDIPIPFKVYNSNMEPIESFWGVGDGSAKGWGLYGTVAKGSLIYEMDKPVHKFDFKVLRDAYFSPHVFESKIKLTLTNERPEKKHLPKVKDAKNFEVFQLPETFLEKDIYGGDVLEYSPTQLDFYMGGYNGFKYSIPFSIENVPSLLDGEAIELAYLIPFNHRLKNQGNGIDRAQVRICIFTNKGRILHNFPDRRTGLQPLSDLFKFDESTVYNTYQKFMPTNDKSKAVGRYRYFPVLKDYDYDQFVGRVAGTTGFVDHFNTGGIPPIDDKPLLDVLVKDSKTFSKLTFNSMVRDQKMTTFANYNTEEGSEPFVIGTNNGGQLWYVKAYFACTDYYNYMRGGRLDFSPIVADAGAYVPNSLQLCRKRFNTPTEALKEPATPFLNLEEDKSLIVSIGEQDGTVLITTADDLDYDGVYPIVFLKNISANENWNPVCNTYFQPTGTPNDGAFFRAKKVAPNKYLLYGDIGNPYEGNLVCRHLHAINRTQSGWLISTGEAYLPTGYQGGFLYFMEENTRNGGTVLNSEQKRPIFRLSSTMNGINRTSGAYMFNDSVDPTIIIASDDVSPLDKRVLEIPDRTISMRASVVGIYKGKLSDIDDFSKWECICETKQAQVSMVEHMGNFASDGFSGALAVSKGGLEWSIISNEPKNRVNGTDFYGNIYFGNKVIKFK